jgi:hypothetical protein
MPNAKISDGTALTAANVADGDLLRIVDISAGTSGSKKIEFLEARRYLLTPRGALVTKAANATGLNYSAAFVAVPWDDEAGGGYDTDSCHDNVTNNTRLSVPSGWSWVRVGYGFAFANVNSANWVQSYARKTAGGNYLGMPLATWSATTATSPAIVAWSPPLQVTGGTDYFEAMVSCQDTSMDIIADASWFAIELLA